jgi:hypothetical protein
MPAPAVAGRKPVLRLAHPESLRGCLGQGDTIDGRGGFTSEMRSHESHGHSEIQTLDMLASRAKRIR